MDNSTGGRETRIIMRPARAAAAASMVLLTSCAASTPGYVEVETWSSPRHIVDAAWRTELLVGETVGNQACFWTGAHPGEGFYVLWPEGSRALEDPLRVIDAHGDLIATVGDTISPHGAPLRVEGTCGDTYSRAYAMGPTTVEF
ncbi:hypothetical protein J4H86_09765 [Spiractinospora alimapuensis]|uniref:hypothetical protein n=1 Tax=Spiractinospora alimapuensis TaxID=2820884 RepID=UPI001F1F6F0E|nr:hypothetical protein [Spiractinospora alimapuensis]QVQ53958.1 hypothetical protein J4H86_09765 [Spiractinospora alimapuensis]